MKAGKIAFFFKIAFYLSTIGAQMNVHGAEQKLFGMQAKAIQVACQEFERKLNVPWKDYLVSIDESEAEFVIIFSAKSATAEFRGSPAGVPGFEVRIRKSDYRVESSQFSR